MQTVNLDVERNQRAERLAQLKDLSQVFINQKPFFFRDGTSDSIILTHNVLCEPTEREYKFAPGQPKVILDIGANIGAISVLMAILYPDAKIFAFEPVKENFNILLMNIAEYNNIVAFNFALGDRNEKRHILQSSDALNHGGHSFNAQGCNPLALAESVDVKNINEVIEGIGLENIDLIKIDCEGSEAEILMGLDDAKLEKVGMILGEMHSQRDFELLDHLSRLFHLEFKKEMTDINYQFRAIKRQEAKKP